MGPCWSTKVAFFNFFRDINHIIHSHHQNFIRSKCQKKERKRKSGERADLASKAYLNLRDRGTKFLPKYGDCEKTWKYWEGGGAQKCEKSTTRVRHFALVPMKI
jgi:hypothetical protein